MSLLIPYQVLITDRSVEVHRFVLSRLPLLRHLLSVQTSEDQVDEVCKALQAFKRSARLSLLQNHLGFQIEVRIFLTKSQYVRICFTSQE